jgi:hypothetical protein
VTFDFMGNEAIPIISLWPPWANWVMLGWKPIETRTHNRFKSLAGKRIGIHATIAWDTDAIKLARPYLTLEQVGLTMNFLRIGGAILGTAFVEHERELTADDSLRALIDCGGYKRHGLFLSDIRIIEAIPAKGKQGIWYDTRLTEAAETLPSPVSGRGPVCSSPVYANETFKSKRILK